MFLLSYRDPLSLGTSFPWMVSHWNIHRSWMHFHNKINLVLEVCRKGKYIWSCNMSQKIMSFRLNHCAWNRIYSTPWPIYTTIRMMICTDPNDYIESLYGWSVQWYGLCSMDLYHCTESCTATPIDKWWLCLIGMPPLQMSFEMLFFSWRKIGSTMSFSIQLDAWVSLLWWCIFLSLLSCLWYYWDEPKP